MTQPAEGSCVRVARAEALIYERVHADVVKLVDTLVLEASASA